MSQKPTHKVARDRSLPQLAQRLSLPDDFILASIFILVWGWHDISCLLGTAGWHMSLAYNDSNASQAGKYLDHSPHY
jgi:hypothetical protein